MNVVGFSSLVLVLVCIGRNTEIQGKLNDRKVQRREARSQGSVGSEASWRCWVGVFSVFLSNLLSRSKVHL